MRICILMGSPRLSGNTAELLKPFIDELKLLNADVEYIPLHSKEVKPCLGCYKCQHIPDEYGCVLHDDMQGIVNEILKADLLVFAAPVYTWQFPVEIKAVMDRMYGLNKYYGRAPLQRLNKGQSYALVVTCGYEPDYGAGPLEEGFKRWCLHSEIEYFGMYAVRDIDDLASFQTEEAVTGAQDFARKLVSAIEKQET